jgi:hypothetical protein
VKKTPDEHGQNKSGGFNLKAYALGDTWWQTRYWCISANGLMVPASPRFLLVVRREVQSAVVQTSLGRNGNCTSPPPMSLLLTIPILTCTTPFPRPRLSQTSSLPHQLSETLILHQFCLFSSLTKYFYLHHGRRDHEEPYR